MLIMNEISLPQGAGLLLESNEGGRGWHPKKIDIEKRKVPHSTEERRTRMSK